MTGHVPGDIIRLLLSQCESHFPAYLISHVSRAIMATASTRSSLSHSSIFLFGFIMRPRRGNFTFLNWLYAVSVEAGGEIASLYEQ